MALIDDLRRAATELCHRDPKQAAEAVIIGLVEVTGSVMETMQLIIDAADALQKAHRLDERRGDAGP